METVGAREDTELLVGEGLHALLYNIRMLIKVTALNRDYSQKNNNLLVTKPIHKQCIKYPIHVDSCMPDLAFSVLIKLSLS